MPRKSRVIVPTCPHHVVQRGHNRNVVFVCDDDFQYYLENLKEAKLEYGIKVYAYCLMTNRVHLILEPGDSVASIGWFMKRLAARQTRYVNKLNGVLVACGKGVTRSASLIQTNICWPVAGM